MSSMKDKFNQFFAMEDDVDYEDIQETPQAEQSTNQVNEKPARKKTAPTNVKTTNNNNVYALQKHSNVQVSIVEPRFYSEIEPVGELLLNQHIVVLNLHRADNKQGVRMIDFLNGVVFSIKGEIKRVGENIFVCTPPNVTLDGLDHMPMSTKQ